MHVGIVIDHLGGYGTEQVICRLSSGLIERGHRVDIILMDTIIHRQPSQNVRVFLLGGAPDRLTEELSPDVLARAIQLHSRSRTLEWAHQAFDWVRVANAFHWNVRHVPGRRLFRMARPLASYLEVERPDCVLANLSLSTVATLMGYCMAGIRRPVVPVIHENAHTYLLTSTSYRFWIRYLYPKAAHFVGVSQGTSDTLATAVGVPREKITTIYNPIVSPDLHAKAAEQPDHPWFRDNGAPVILAVARLEKEKDHPTLIRAFALLSARLPCRLIILGEGSKRTEIEGLVKELNLTDRVSLPGWVENPFAFMARASLFVLSSLHEGFGNVLAEALACGCPCISTDCPSGPAEILQGGEFGGLVPVGDPAALAAEMERMLKQSPDRQMLQRRGADFSVDRAVTAYETLLHDLVRAG